MNTHVATNVFFANEVLSAQVVFSHLVTVDDGQGANAVEDEVLGDFGTQGFDGDEQDVGRAHSVHERSVPSLRCARNNVYLS